MVLTGSCTTGGPCSAIIPARRSGGRGRYCERPVTWLAPPSAADEQGLISVLRQLHDDLDAEVFAAYGWPTALTDEEILS
jgi:hypothetical protein